MIEISHQQARRWIREHLDHRLPDGQWAALQAHLEICRECSSYLNAMEGVEKNLHRALRVGMESLPDPAERLMRQVIDTRQARAVVRKRLVMVGLGLVALAMFFLLGGFSGIAQIFSFRATPALAAGSSATQTPPGPVAGGNVIATPMPTAGPGDFPAVVLYEGRKDGQANGKRQIYLLNPGSAPEPLVNDDANDYSPAWSSDGEWVAFISDRAGKDEIFVTNVAGSQVVQLTDSPGITWEGPLSWSADGHWLALSGVRETQGGQRWVYLVPLDGSGARALPGSRGGSLPKFAPFGDRLAYTFTDGTQAGITINHIDTGQYSSTNWLDNPLAPPLAEGSALDWSNDGTQLVFIAPQPAQVAATNGVPPTDGSVGSQVMAIRDLNDTIEMSFDYTYNYRAAESRWPGAFRGASWLSNGAILYLEDLGDARANNEPARPGGCWTLQAHSLTLRGSDARTFSLSQLCVEGGLDRGSWTPDGRWLVVSGRMPGEKDRSLYAVPMPGRGFGFRNNFDGGRNYGQGTMVTPLPTLPPGDSARFGTTATVLRLADTAWLGDLPRVRPRLRSYSSPLQIQPKAIQLKRDNLKSSNLTQHAGGPTGQIVYVVQNNSTSVVVRANPDGTGGKVLAATPGENRCPRWSPDGKWIALVSQQGNLVSAVSGGGKLEKPVAAQTTVPDSPGMGTGEAIFLMDEDGGSVRQLTRSDNLPGLSGQNDPSSYTFNCPVWSPLAAPGGPYIAVTFDKGGDWYLAVIRVNADANDPGTVRFMQIARPAQWTNPTWAPDGRSLYLSQVLDSGGPVRLLRVNLPAGAQDALESEVIYEDLTRRILGLVAAPDNQQVFALIQSQTASGMALTHLLTLNPSYSLQSRSIVLGNDDARNPILSGSLAPLGLDSLGFILRGGPQDAHQAAIYRYDAPSRQFLLLARVDDVLNEAAWSPDGRYVIYSTESGLWGLDLHAAQLGAAGPVWLSPQPVLDIDWR